MYSNKEQTKERRQYMRDNMHQYERCTTESEQEKRKVERRRRTRGDNERERSKQMPRKRVEKVVKRVCESVKVGVCEISHVCGAVFVIR